MKAELQAAHAHNEYLADEFKFAYSGSKIAEKEVAELHERIAELKQRADASEATALELKCNLENTANDAENAAFEAKVVQKRLTDHILDLSNKLIEAHEEIEELRTAKQKLQADYFDMESFKNELEDFCSCPATPMLSNTNHS